MWNQVQHGKEENNLWKLVNRQFTIDPIAIPIYIAGTITRAISIFNAIIRRPAVLAYILLNLSKFVQASIAYNLCYAFDLI